MSQPFRVLTIDGGGIRGLIPLRLLAEIEQRTGRPVCALFDLVAASSVGAILALIMTRPGEDDRPPHSAREVLEIFRGETGRIFPRRWWHDRPVVGFVGSLLQPRYAPEGLESVLREYLGAAPLGAALTRLLIAAYDIECGEPRLFRSWDPTDTALPMWEVARATSAAPGLLPPARISGHPGAFVDGALFADNAQIGAYLGARQIAGDGEFVVASLGCGRLPVRLDHERVSRQGLLAWGPRIVGIALDGASRMVDAHMARLLPDGPRGRRTFRFQPALDPARWSLDDISPENQAALLAIAENIIQNESDALDDLCRLLTGGAA